MSNGEKIEEIIFIYDGDDLIGAKYGNNTYYYVKNIFGDVTAVLNESGQSVVDYSYTAWGTMLVEYKHTNHDPAHFANVNPMKYRSYYYDAEIDMYYLQSRYYWLPLCRFLNADLPDYARIQKNETAGINLFAYCNNDPVNNADPTGFSAKKKTVKKLVSYINSKLNNYSLKNNNKKKDKYFYFYIPNNVNKVVSNLKATDSALQDYNQIITGVNVYDLVTRIISAKQIVKSVVTAGRIAAPSMTIIYLGTFVALTVSHIYIKKLYTEIEKKNKNRKGVTVRFNYIGLYTVYEGNKL